MLLPYRCGASMQDRQVYLVFKILYVPAGGVVLAGLSTWWFRNSILSEISIEIQDRTKNL